VSAGSHGVAGFVVRCRYVQPDGVGYLTGDGACTTQLRDAKVFRSAAEAWEFAIPVMGDGDDAWVEEVEIPARKATRP
jgi:hypothetical protein